MQNQIYVPRSLRDAAKHIRLALKTGLAVLTKQDFVRGWSSVAYLYPGLHPDGFEEPDSGWPRVLQRFAAEAWRRAKSGELTDNELYCWQSGKARIGRERNKIKRKYPWLFSDHFAV